MSSMKYIINIINDNVQDTYNPEAINSMFSMNLFNEAMRRLSSLNQSFTTILSEQTDLQNELLGIKQLLYSQTDLNIINRVGHEFAGFDPFAIYQAHFTNQVFASVIASIEFLNLLHS